MKTKTIRKPFIMKLTLPQHDKINEESEKLGLTKTGFVSLLIANYKSLTINQ